MSDAVKAGDWRDRLRQVLEEKNVSKRRASLDAGLGPGAVHSWLVEGKEPSVSHLTGVARALGVSLIWLTKGYNITPEAEEILSRLENDPAATDSVLTLLRARAVG
jgi:transcriptional regulator with XRE-family HTH domain